MFKSATLCLALLSILWLTSCDVDIDLDDCIDGKGPLTTVSRVVDPFIAVSSEGSFNVVLKHGNRYRVEIEGESNVIEELITSVERNTLLLRFGFKHCISQREDLTVTVYYPAGKLEAIDLGGSGNIRGDSIQRDFVNLFLLGSGNIDIPLNCTRVKATVAGSGNIDVKGTVQNADFRLTGSGELNALTLICEKVDIDLLGSGNAYLFVEDRLDATINGSGSVFYLGNPDVFSETNGSGKVGRY